MLLDDAGWDAGGHAAFWYVAPNDCIGRNDRAGSDSGSAKDPDPSPDPHVGCDEHRGSDALAFDASILWFDLMIRVTDAAVLGNEDVSPYLDATSGGDDCRLPHVRIVPDDEDRARGHLEAAVAVQEHVRTYPQLSVNAKIHVGADLEAWADADNTQTGEEPKPDCAEVQRQHIQPIADRETDASWHFHHLCSITTDRRQNAGHS